MMNLGTQPISGREVDKGYLSTLLTLSTAGTLETKMGTNSVGLSSVQRPGVGLSNTRQRVEAIYENQARLEVGALAKGDFVANIIVPSPVRDVADTEVLA